MLKISDLKPSIVLSAMVAGLLKSKDDPLFKINMGSFGEVKYNLCYGCCATVALAEMFGNGKLPSELMFDHVKANKSNHSRYGYAEAYLSDVLSLEPSSAQDSLPTDKFRNFKLRDLELAVDKARIGDVSVLIEALTGEVNKSFDDRWCLEDPGWEEQIPKIEAAIVEMIAAGY